MNALYHQHSQAAHGKNPCSIVRVHDCADFLIKGTEMQCMQREREREHSRQVGFQGNACVELKVSEHM